MNIYEKIYNNYEECNIFSVKWSKSERNEDDIAWNKSYVGYSVIPNTKLYLSFCLSPHMNT